jgi:acyl-CoA synthetase (AMP-forming)/AMP-acid ligase II
MGCGIVPNQSFDHSHFKLHLQSQFGPAMKIAILELKEIPRNQMGKVLRKDLTEKYLSTFK